jgi:hypothetical protein
MMYRFVELSLRSMFLSLFRLWINMPAPTNNTRARADWSTTRRRCRSEAPEVVERAPLRRASAGFALDVIHAGATPKRMPVRSETPKAKASTTPEGLASMGTFCAPGKAMARSMRVPA